MPRRNVTFTAMWEHDVWDGSTKTKPKWDDNRYYLISTGAELAWFQGGTHAIGKAKLVCDIDLGYHDLFRFPTVWRNLTDAVIRSMD